MRLPLLATNGVRYARPKRQAAARRPDLHPPGHHPRAAGRLLPAHRERHLKAPPRWRLFRRSPRGPGRHGGARPTSRLHPRRPRLPLPRLPAARRRDAAAYLRQITWNGARARFRPLTARAQAQLEKELDLIEKLDLAGYFLIVWDIVQFCQREKILAQGRGSAANSAVCYALRSPPSIR